MVDLFETYLASDDASPEEREAMRAALAADPALAADFAAVAAAERDAAHRWEALAPDRSLLVLLALDGAGYALDADERARLDAARPALARLLDTVPAAHTVVARIADDARAFDACWDEPADAPEPAPFARAAARGPVPRARTLRHLAWRASLAFTLVLMAVVGTLLLRRDRSQLVYTAQSAQSIRLPDGTAVDLRPGATLSYATAGFERRRTVTLDGNALFSVTTTGAPFSVRTPSGVVTVTGTVFGVRSSAAHTEVTLVEGRVMLASKDAATGVTLSPGEQSRVVPGALPTTPVPVELAQTLAWSGRFYFRNTPLGTAAERLAVHYKVSVATTPRVAAERVNGEFDDTMPLPDILATLAASVPGLTVERRGDGYVLR